MQPVGVTRLNKISRISGWWSGCRITFLFGLFQLLQPGASLIGPLHGEPVETIINRAGLGSGKRLTIPGAGDGLPHPWLAGGFDPVLGRNPVEKPAVAITSPDHSVEGFQFRKFQLYPSLSRLIGNPGLTVPCSTIMDVLQLVYLKSLE